MTWKNELTLPFYICDYTDHLTLWSLARLFQDAADDHTTHFGLGFSDLIKENKAWILSRAYYKVYQMPQASQHVTIQTWSRRADRLCAMRDTQLLSDQGDVLACSTAMWVIMDMNKRCVCRMLPQVISFEHELQQATERLDLEKIKLPPMTDNHLLSAFVAQHSAIDHNLHVNNADYIRWAIDALKTSEDSELKDAVSIKDLEINYFIETHLGDEVKVFMMQCQETPARRLFEIINPRGIAATLIMNLK
jgi:medium-chain acyl-[acyl-carrier-protein] hydrolase